MNLAHTLLQGFVMSWVPSRSLFLFSFHDLSPCIRLLIRVIYCSIMVASVKSVVTLNRSVTPHQRVFVKKYLSSIESMIFFNFLWNLGEIVTYIIILGMGGYHSSRCRVTHYHRTTGCIQPPLRTWNSFMLPCALPHPTLCFFYVTRCR